MQIREGAYYVTRNGSTVGPATPNVDGYYPWNIPFDGRFLAYSDDGIICVADSDWDIVGEAPGQNPTPWRDMTPEQKGALLLAQLDGKAIQVSRGNGWNNALNPKWEPDCAYRVRPEPEREVVTLYGGCAYDWAFEDARQGGKHNTHRITFDLLDGKPDCTSIKMEEIQ